MSNEWDATIISSPTSASQDARRLAIHARMRLERARLFYGDYGVEIELDAVVDQMLQIPGFAVGQPDQPVAFLEAMQPLYGVVEGLELLPYLHEFVGFVVRERDVVGAQRVQEGVLATVR